MLEPVSLGEALQILVTFATGVTIIAIVKNDIKWIIKWCADHKETDDDRYNEIKEELRSLKRHNRNNWYDEG